MVEWATPGTWKKEYSIIINNRIFGSNAQG